MDKKQGAWSRVHGGKAWRKSKGQVAMSRGKRGSYQSVVLQSAVLQSAVLQSAICCHQFQCESSLLRIRQSEKYRVHDSI